MNTDFKSAVLTVIERYQMLSSRDTVVAGLSGGADSMALVSVLNALKSEYNLRIIAAHVNHGLRGEEALRDEKFAESFCESLGIEFRVLHADVPALAERSGMSFEECGRKVRYDFFSAIAEDVGLRNVKIATAHNAQDTAETLIMNLARGTGLRGLTGIPPVRPLYDGGPLVIRPLSECSRESIEQYIAGLGLSFVTDSTNLDPTYKRNRIRLKILPELEEINSGALANIIRCAENLRKDGEYLDGLAKEAEQKAELPDGGYNAELLKNLSTPVLSRVVSDILYLKSGIHPEKIHIDKASELISGGGQAQLTGGLIVKVFDGVLTFPGKSIAEKPEDFCEEVNLDCKTTYTLPYADVKFEIKAFENSNLILENVLDYDKINSNFLLRNRRAGDRINLPKRKVTKTLKNLFNEAGIAPEKRYSVTIIENDGEIAWLEGFGPSAGYIADSNTKRVMTIKIVRR